MTAARSEPALTVGLVVVNFCSAALTDELLTAAAGGADEVVVVDCTPQESGLEALVKRHAARLVDPGCNVGYGAAANLGAELLRTDVVAFANADVTIDAAGLRALAGRAFGAGLVAPRLTFPDGRLQPSAHRREPGLLLTLWELSVAWAAVATRIGRGWNPTLLSDAEHEQSREVLHVMGALLVVDAGAFAAVGGFDPGFFLYREETDLCRRLRLAGWSIRHEPVVTAVHHLHGSTPGTASLAPGPQRLRSHYRYIGKHWGNWARFGARCVGTLATVTSVLTGPDRRAWLRVLRWHLVGR